MGKERDGKGQIEEKLEKFIQRVFEHAGVDYNKEDASISRKQASEFFKNLMERHKMEDAWDQEEFNVIFNLFEEDENSNDDEGGLDKGEFLKLVKRIAQL